MCTVLQRFSAEWRSRKRTGSGSGIMTSLIEQGAPTMTASRRHKTSRSLLSRLRCGLQTHVLCTAGLSCKPSTSSSTSNSDLPRLACRSVSYCIKASVPNPPPHIEPIIIFSLAKSAARGAICCEQVLFLAAFVCVCLSLSAQNVENQ